MNRQFLSDFENGTTLKIICHVYKFKHFLEFVKKFDLSIFGQNVELGIIGDEIMEKNIVN